MKTAWMLVMAVVAAAGFAPTARADDTPETAATSRVTYYLELGKMPGEKSEALVALLKREFPGATVELLDGTLRVQTDGSTFEAFQKVLESQRLEGLPAPDKKDREKEIKREREDRKPVLVEENVEVRGPSEAVQEAIQAFLKRLGSQLAKVHDAPAGGDLAKIKVKVGELCAGCADCLADALSKEFPALRFLPDESDVVVLADAAGQAAVQAWLAGLRGLAKGDTAQVEEASVEDSIVVIKAGDGKDARIHLKGSGPKPAPAVEELERLLRAAREAGREREVHKLEAALVEARKAHPRRPMFVLEGVESGKGTIGRDEVRRHLVALRGELGGLLRAEDRPDIGALRERFDALRTRLEGARARRPGKAPPVAAPRDPLAKEHTKDQPQGPMAEWRQRVMHLKQAVEHLNAAGYEGLAKQVAEAAAQAAAQAEEVARKVRAAEEAREAEHRKERARAEAEEAAAREKKKARVEAGHEREGGDELTGLIRRLHQQVEELRKEVRELREKVGGERRDAR